MSYYYQVKDIHLIINPYSKSLKLRNPKTTFINVNINQFATNSLIDQVIIFYIYIDENSFWYDGIELNITVHR